MITNLDECCHYEGYEAAQVRTITGNTRPIVGDSAAVSLVYSVTVGNEL